MIRRPVTLANCGGGDAVHPLPEAYDALTSAIERDILMENARYINPPSRLARVPPKDPRRTSAKRDNSGLTGALLPFQGETPTIHQCGPPEPAEEEVAAAPASEEAESPSVALTPSAGDGEENKQYSYPFAVSNFTISLFFVLKCHQLRVLRLCFATPLSFYFFKYRNP